MSRSQLLRYCSRRAIATPPPRYRHHCHRRRQAVISNVLSLPSLPPHYCSRRDITAAALPSPQRCRPNCHRHTITANGLLPPPHYCHHPHCRHRAVTFDALLPLPPPPHYCNRHNIAAIALPLLPRCCPHRHRRTIAAAALLLPPPPPSYCSRRAVAATAAATLLQLPRCCCYQHRRTIPAAALSLTPH